MKQSNDEDDDYNYSITMMIMSTDDEIIVDNLVSLLLLSRWIDVLIVFYLATASYMYLLYMFLWHSVLTVTFIRHRMVTMLSIGPVNIKNGMLRSFSS